MFRNTLLTLAALAMATPAMVGCEASARLGGWGRGAAGHDEAQLAAYAAAAKYPQDVQPRDDCRVAVLTHGDDLRLVNFTSEPIRDVNVWINGMFVHKVDIIPAMGSVTLDRNVFYDATGRPMSKAQTTPVRVTLQDGNDMYTTLGPVIDER